MAEKKRGLLDRFFGTPSAPEPEVPLPTGPEQFIDEALDTPLVLPPNQEIALADALREDGRRLGGPQPEEMPGPPEMMPPTAPKPRQNWLQRLASGLKRSSDQLTGGIAAVFT